VSGSVPIARVTIDPIDDSARVLWDAALDLADELPGRGWTLVGGLMVQLHAYRYGQSGVRATTDIDILANSREQPRSLTEVIAERLLVLGYEAAHHTGLMGPPTLYRFEREREVVDVLGPDGLKGMPPKTIGKNETFQVPAGTQALARTETVEVQVQGGRVGVLRCPSLPAALLLKIRATNGRDQDRTDLVALLGCVDDPITLRQHFSKRELGWLRNAKNLRIGDSDLADLFPAAQLTRARAAYTLLTAV
jgi:hypothetical protein